VETKIFTGSNSRGGKGQGEKTTTMSGGGAGPTRKRGEKSTEPPGVEEDELGDGSLALEILQTREQVDKPRWVVSGNNPLNDKKVVIKMI